MPQLFQVLRCFKCQVFQIHHVKKSWKFECKMCGEKQSIKRHYGIGTGKDCRLHVQKLNSIRGKAKVDSENVSDNSENSDAENVEIAEYNNSCNVLQSKWGNYIEQSEDSSHPQEESTMYLDDVEVVLDIPKKKNKGSCVKQCESTNNKIKIKTSNAIDKGYDQKHLENNQFQNRQSYTTTVNTEQSFSPQIKIRKTDKIAKENLNSTKDMPTQVPNNSKWNQYVCADDFTFNKSNSMESNGNIVSCESKHIHELFSLSDNNDIDDILNIV